MSNEKIEFWSIHNPFWISFRVVFVRVMFAAMYITIWASIICSIMMKDYVMAGLQWICLYLSDKIFDPIKYDGYVE